jgi:hypothetical protein
MSADTEKAQEAKDMHPIHPPIDSIREDPAAHNEVEH